MHSETFFINIRSWVFWLSIIAYANFVHCVKLSAAGPTAAVGSVDGVLPSTSEGKILFHAFLKMG